MSLEQAEQLSWWEASESVAYLQCFDMIRTINKRLVEREESNLHHARMYSNSYFQSLAPQGYFAMPTRSVTKQKLSLNLIASICDTVAARVSKSKTKVTFLTDKGDYSLQTKAKKLDKFILGQFYSTKIYDVMRKVFLDSLVQDMGVVKVYGEEGKIKLERVIPNEIKVDPIDSIYGSPSHLYQVKFVTKATLLGWASKVTGKSKTDLRNKIKTASDQLCVKDSVTGDKTDFAIVVEGWRLPSYPGAKDGKHIICLNNTTLLFEDYEKDHYPFVFLRWSERLVGFFGQGIAERLNGIQLEVNSTLRDIQYSRQFFSVPFIGLPMGSKINKAQLNNSIAHIVDFIDNPPQFLTPPIAHTQWFDHLDRLIRQAYEIAGVSQLSATSKKPAGLDAGVALRTYQDIESERFNLVAQRFEQSHVDVSSLMVEVARELYSDDKSFSVKVPGKKFIEEIKWSEVDLEDDQYLLKQYPTSLLPETPAARLQYVSELAERGYITRDRALAMLDFPDTDAEISLMTANHDFFAKVVDEALNKGNYFPPEPNLNLTEGMKFVAEAIIRAQVDEIEEEKVDLLRQWNEEAQAMVGGSAEAAMAEEQPAAQQAAGASPEMAGAVAQMMPVQ
jgi:hypothetical protein